MNAPELRQLLKSEPFAPIRLHMSDGGAFDIRHPEMAMLTVHTVHVGLEASARDGIPERVEYLSLRHIVTAEPLVSRVPDRG
ncbi:MAG: hypothetical protein AB7U20_13540 [Planctomycetaceae bacterium]